MVDISKHLTRVKQATERRNWALALEICEECMDVAPAELELYKLYVDAAKRKAKETGKPSMFSTMGLPAMSKDPLKVLIGAMKRVAANPDVKSLAAAGDAARAYYKSGTKPMMEPAIYLYEEMLATGLFNAEVLWNLGHLYYERSQEKDEVASIDLALRTLAKLEAAMPNHPEAGRTLKNWEAKKSFMLRNAKGSATDYTSQVASTDKARRAEVMNRNIRTIEDAREVLKYVDEEVKIDATKKDPWLKKAETHRRIAELTQSMDDYAAARDALEKAQAIDQYDYNVVMKIGDIAIEERKLYIRQLEAAQQDTAAAKQDLLQVEIDEYRKRAERQPTELGHKFNLGVRLIQSGQIETAAAEFQRTVNDPKFRLKSHKFLGFCFAKKNMVDLAVKNYTAYLTQAEDTRGDETKEVRYLRARQYEQAKRIEEAIADYSQLVEMDLSYKDCATRLDKLRAESGG